MQERKERIAAEGKVLTNGTHYVKAVFFAVGADPNSYWQITKEEYNAILKNEQAEAEDYESELSEFGVII